MEAGGGSAAAGQPAMQQLPVAPPPPTGPLRRGMGAGWPATHVHVVGGGRHLLVLLAGEDVDAHKVALGVAVLPRLGGGHIHDLRAAGQRRTRCSKMLGVHRQWGTASPERRTGRASAWAARAPRCRKTRGPAPWTTQAAALAVRSELHPAAALALAEPRGFRAARLPAPKVVGCAPVPRSPRPQQHCTPCRDRPAWGHAVQCAAQRVNAMCDDSKIHASHLAGAALGNHEAVLADGARLLGERQTGAGIRRLERLMIVLRHPVGQMQSAGVPRSAIEQRRPGFRARPA